MQMNECASEQFPGWTCSEWADSNRQSPLPPHRVCPSQKKASENVGTASDEGATVLPSQSDLRKNRWFRSSPLESTCRTTSSALAEKSNEASVPPCLFSHADWAAGWLSSSLKPRYVVVVSTFPSTSSSTYSDTDAADERSSKSSAHNLENRLPASLSGRASQQPTDTFCIRNVVEATSSGTSSWGSLPPEEAISRGSTMLVTVAWGSSTMICPVGLRVEFGNMVLDIIGTATKWDSPQPIIARPLTKSLFPPKVCRRSMSKRSDRSSVLLALDVPSSIMYCTRDGSMRSSK
mmetsp:Transcript_15316/g.33042  ORF Transcript_15316/g.33042 Transcript_15316/m.33042 type:complete len:292 (-) Transcript_15316:920-1795(-)